MFQGRMTCSRPKGSSGLVRKYGVGDLRHGTYYLGREALCDVRYYGRRGVKEAFWD